MRHICCVCGNILEENEAIKDPEGDIVCGNCWNIEKEEYEFSTEATKE